MLDLSVISALLGYFILIWRRTDAFVEYIRLFRLGYLFHVDEYFNVQKNGYDGNYADFLQEYYSDKFLVRLATCPICLSFWIGLFCFIFSQDLRAYICGPLSLFFYLLFNKLI
jgi:hypothetical protein